MGNLRSIVKKFEMIKVSTTVSSNPEEIKAADKLVLPGVGHFKQGMHNIEERGLLAVLKEKVVKEGTPILGVCVGMQLFAEHSEEGDCQGLGFIKGKVVRFNIEDKVPHVGWNNINIKKESSLLENIPQNTRFYFTHSYHLTDIDEGNILATTDYGYEFTSIIKQDNIYGTQFHPEKSHITGLEIYKNFVNHC